jgi:hypothetical protein
VRFFCRALQVDQIFLCAASWNKQNRVWLSVERVPVKTLGAQHGQERQQRRGAYPNQSNLEPLLKNIDNANRF